jgi:ribosomal protein S14
MQHLVIKDAKRRLMYRKVERKRYQSFIFLKDYLLIKSPFFNHKIIRNAFLKSSSYQYSSLAKIRNRCILTGKGRAVFKKYKLSRTRIRLYSRFPAIYGLQKLSW